MAIYTEVNAIKVSYNFVQTNIKKRNVSVQLFVQAKETLDWFRGPIFDTVFLKQNINNTRIKLRLFPFRMRYTTTISHPISIYITPASAFWLPY